MPKLLSIARASAHPREQYFRADWSLLQIKLDGNIQNNNNVMRAKAGPQGEIDVYRYDMNGKPVMVTASLPDTIKYTGNVSIVGPKEPCSFCMGVRKQLKAWMKRWQA